MSLVKRMRHLEKRRLRIFNAHIEKFSNEELIAEFLRLARQDFGAVTVEQIEARIVAVGGDLEAWRPILYEQMERMGLKRKSTRIRREGTDGE